MNSRKRILLEQYKLYVQMADNISQRRTGTKHFYLSLLSVLIGVPIIFNTNLFKEGSIISVAFALFGIMLCLLWIINLKSYKQINSGKFLVIHEMEKELPFKCYKKEWEMLGEGKNKIKYLQLTVVEQIVPYSFLLPFIIPLLFFISSYI